MSSTGLLSPAHTATAIVLWLVFTLQVVRAAVQGKLREGDAWSVWTIFFLGCVTFTLWGEPIDHKAEAALSGLPLTVYIKVAALILASHFYTLILMSVDARLKSQYAWLTWLAPGVLSAGTALLMYAAWTGDSLTPYGRLVIIALRDALQTFRRH